MKQINLDEHFLKKDQLQAAIHLGKVGDSLNQVIDCYKQIDFDQAKEYTIEMLASLQAITKLAEDKQVHDKYSQMLEGMPTVTHIEISRMTRP